MRRDDWMLAEELRDGVLGVRLTEEVRARAEGCREDTRVVLAREATEVRDARGAGAETRVVRATGAEAGDGRLARVIVPPLRCDGLAADRVADEDPIRVVEGLAAGLGLGADSRTREVPAVRVEGRWLMRVTFEVLLRDGRGDSIVLVLTLGAEVLALVRVECVVAVLARVVLLDVARGDCVGASVLRALDGVFARASDCVRVVQVDG